MKVVDANVLLYAVNRAARHHEASRRWLDDALGGGDAVGFTWIVSLAFLRLSTSHAVFASPLSARDAADQLGAWLEAPGAVQVPPSAAHLSRLADLLIEAGTGGNLVNDAHLAAVALEQRATVVTYDADFGRFAGVRRSTPLDLLPQD